MNKKYKFCDNKINIKQNQLFINFVIYSILI